MQDVIKYTWYRDAITVDVIINYNPERDLDRFKINLQANS